MNSMFKTCGERISGLAQSAYQTTQSGLIIARQLPPAVRSGLEEGRYAGPREAVEAFNRRLVLPFQQRQIPRVLEQPVPVTRPELLPEFESPFLDQPMLAVNRNDERWENCPRHLRSNLLRASLVMYRKEKGREALDDFLADLGTHLAIVEDPNRWFSAGLFRRFNEKLIEELGDDVAYQGGRKTPDSLYPYEKAYVQAVARVAGMFAVYRTLINASRHFSNVTNWEAGREKGNTIDIAFRPEPGIGDHLSFCDNRRGFLETIPTVNHEPEAIVEHRHCMHLEKDQDHCLYRVTVDNAMAALRQTPAYLTGAGILATPSMLLLGQKEAALAVSAFTAGAFVINQWQVSKDRQRNKEVLQGSAEATDRAQARETFLTKKLVRASKAELCVDAGFMEDFVDQLEEGKPIESRILDATIWFADICGFTSKCFSTPDERPDLIRAAVNQWIRIAVPIIKKHGGYVDKYGGDNIMAIFLKKEGAMHPALAAAFVSCELQRELRKRREEIEAQNPEFTDVEISVGFSHGKVDVGLVGGDGSEDLGIKLEFSALGSPVNRAARVEKATGNSEISLDENTVVDIGRQSLDGEGDRQRFLIEGLRILESHFPAVGDYGLHYFKGQSQEGQKDQRLYKIVW